MITLLFVGENEASPLFEVAKHFMVGKQMVLTGTSPFEALDALTKENVDVIVAEYDLKYMNGLELFYRAKDIAPDTKRILLSEVPHPNEEQNHVIHQSILAGGLPEQIIEVIQEVNQQIRSAREIKITCINDENHREITEKLLQKTLDHQYHIYNLRNELHATSEGALQLLRSVTEIYDRFLWQHNNRVFILCDAISRKINISREELEQLRAAALLHDTGKIGLPPNLMFKDLEKLSPGEGKILQKHSEQGGMLLSMVPYYREAAHIIQCHHECLDGSGYPRGLLREEIPFASKILAVADTFDYLMIQERLEFHPDTLHKIFKQIRKNYRYKLQGSLVEVLRDVWNDAAQEDVNSKSSFYYKYRNSMSEECSKLPVMQQSVHGAIYYKGGAKKAEANSRTSRQSFVSDREVLDEDDALNCQHIAIEQLIPGMLLAQDLTTKSGIKLAARGTIVDALQLDKMKRILYNDPPEEIVVIKEVFYR